MSQEFRNQFKANAKDFTRNSLVKFHFIIIAILNLIKRTLQVELSSICAKIVLPFISKQAFSAARKKLLPQAFIKLNDTLIEEFYTDNEFKTLGGYLLIGVDGSTLQLPNTEEIKNKYGVCTNHTDKEVPLARISYAFDVLNLITLDAIIDSYKSSERDLAAKHTHHLNHKISHLKHLYLEDRGYPSAALIFFYQRQVKDFLMRVNGNFLKEINQAAQSGKKDSLVTLSLKKMSVQSKNQLKEYLKEDIDLNWEVTIRVIVIELPEGEKQILITSLIDSISYEEFANFYKLRWGSEENYKHHKVHLEIENFSGESAIAIEQEFHATIFTANIRGLVANEAQQEIEKEMEEKNLKYEYKINRNVSLGILKDRILTALWSEKENLEDFCEKLKMEMKSSLIPIKPNRICKRKRKGNKKYPKNKRRCL